jgi:hypothetical protein
MQCTDASLLHGEFEGVVEVEGEEEYMSDVSEGYIYSVSHWHRLWASGSR